MLFQHSTRIERLRMPLRSFHVNTLQILRVAWFQTRQIFGKESFLILWPRNRCKIFSVWQADALETFQRSRNPPTSLAELTFLFESIKNVNFLCASLALTRRQDVNCHWVKNVFLLLFYYNYDRYPGLLFSCSPPRRSAFVLYTRSVTNYSRSLSRRCLDMPNYLFDRFFHCLFL